jgi:hypothetical protein
MEPFQALFVGLLWNPPFTEYVMEPAQASFVGLWTCTYVTALAKQLESTVAPLPKFPLAICTKPLPTSTFTTSLPPLLLLVPVTICRQYGVEAAASLELLGFRAFSS